jgi:hypothetical protein
VIRKVRKAGAVTHRDIAAQLSTPEASQPPVALARHLSQERAGESVSHWVPGGQLGVAMGQLAEQPGLSGAPYAGLQPGGVVR